MAKKIWKLLKALSAAPNTLKKNKQKILKAFSLMSI